MEEKLETGKLAGSYQKTERKGDDLYQAIEV